MINFNAVGYDRIEFSSVHIRTLLNLIIYAIEFKLMRLNPILDEETTLDISLN